MDAEKRKKRDAEIIRLMLGGPRAFAMEPEAIAKRLMLPLGDVVRVLDNYIWVENVAKKFRPRHEAEMEALHRKWFHKSMPKILEHVHPVAALPAKTQQWMDSVNKYGDYEKTRRGT